MRPSRLRRPSVACLAFLAAGLAACGPAQAQATSVTERLIELLVQKGVLPRDQAAALLRQAQEEARTLPRARPAQQASRPAEAAKPQAAAEPVVPPGTVRVTYVPETVRKQIADQVRGEVLAQARNEGWAEPNVLPEWVQRITVFGDVRVRGEYDRLPRSNYPGFVDFNSINAGAGYDVNGTGALPPTVNTTQDRQRERLRARLGVDARIDTDVMAEIRIGTGNDNSPVSLNQTLGQNGPFTKYALWLDRAFVRAGPIEGVTLQAGRGPNPFWTDDLLFYEDLNFDGVSASYARKLTRDVGGFATIGAFPVFNTAFNFTTTGSPKVASRDSFLLAAQAGADWRISDAYAAKLAVGYFNFSNVQGKLSRPCELLYSSDSCSTDETRTLFRQNGNTLFPIRSIVANANSSTGGAMPQYFGLASPFGVLDVHARADATMFKPIDVALEGDFATNLAYSRATVLSKGPVNNYGAVYTSSGVGNGPFKSGANAYMMRLTVGTPTIEKRWDWNVSLAYKYLEADAVLDALNDSDFHLGGTNAKGPIVGGNLGIARNTFLSARWLSANEVSGPPYAADVLQADLNVRF